MNANIIRAKISLKQSITSEVNQGHKRSLLVQMPLFLRYLLCLKSDLYMNVKFVSVKVNITKTKIFVLSKNLFYKNFFRIITFRNLDFRSYEQLLPLSKLRTCLAL